MIIESPIVPSPTHGWTVKRIRDLTMRKFGKRACWYQIKTALALYKKKDVIGCTPTGVGKTMSFWIPLLMALEDGEDEMSMVVTPLNLLGKQNVKAIENGNYCVVVMNPEILMGSEEVDRLWKKTAVTKRLLNFIFDEGHCIAQWGKF
ncbi:P-loop containing nucleoside triphosphate hydrolase protein [Crassisporium funariophilum]|nr:P-loop containing nucleoside triphosphate hydrolase protein [Crassisporium funariophilum]